jgi:hypothetical protein
MSKIARSLSPLVAVGLVAAVSACDESPFEPRGEGERVPVGRVIEDEITTDSVRRYSFLAGSGAEYAVFLEALQGTVWLVVLDSARQRSVASLFAGPNSRPLDENATLNFPTPEGGVHVLTVRTFPVGAAARFRFLVYPVNRAPEVRPAEFSIGDTVAGEALDPMVDADEYLASGEAGQEIVAVAEALGPVGSGTVSLVVVDSARRDLLGFVFADAGTSPPLTTGRFRLPTTQSYRFTFRSVLSEVYPRYRGPYRFWSYAIDRAPEHRSAALPIGSEIRDESIDRAGDVDEFTFQAPAGADFNVFLQSSRPFQLEVGPASGNPLAAVVSSDADTGLFNRATGRFRVPQGGTYIVRVSGTTPGVLADTGSYRFFVYAVDPRPERIPAAIVPGDTVVGEAIDLPGDVDEFTFAGAAGEEFNVFFRAQSGSPETVLRLDAVDANGTTLRVAESFGTDTSLFRQVTGRFALPSTGTHRLRVSGAYTFMDRSRGPYRLFLYRVNRGPESVPGTISFGDSLTGEAIDLPGDLDEFRVTVPDTSGANVVVELASQTSEGTLLSVQLVNSATGQIAAGTSTYVAGTRVASGRVRLSPATYILRVDGSHYQDRPVLRGAYRLWLYRFGFTPELVSDTIAIGDTVSGEVIEPWGDADLFHFYGVKGEHVNVAFQGLAAPSDGAFQAWISGPGAGAPPSVFLVSPTAAAALQDHQTMRVELPVTGWYDISVSGAGGGLSERGAYRLAAERLGVAPEQARAALVPGDSVTTEPIDALGDWDEYTVTATPGQDLGVIVHGNSGTAGPFLQVRVVDPGTGDTLAGTVAQGERVVGPFRVPASGQVTVAVFEAAPFFRICYGATCSGIFRFVGPYAFKVIPINRAPESVPATYTVGDTVRGEALSPLGDRDEFTASGLPGDRLSAYWRLLANPVPQGSLMNLEVVDPATGAVLAGWGASLVGATPGYVSPGSFTVPSAGTYVIRVRSGGLSDYDLGTAPYEFFVTRGP